MSKNSSNDLMTGLGKLVVDSKNKKETGVGKKLLDTHVTPDYSDKQSTMISISDLYAAPKKWNFYNPLDDNKKLELIESIEENGILSPIIVWNVDYNVIENEYSEDEIDVYDFQGNKYLILAGHNRSDAFNKLHIATGDDKYLKIPAFIFESNELDISSAREIIVDTNYVQRVLSVEEMEHSIAYKYDDVEKDKTKKGRTREIVADALGISPSKVAQYKKLSEMYKPLKEKVYSGDIALTSLLKVSDKTLDTQKMIYDEYGDNLSNKLLNKIKPHMKWHDIKKVFDKELEPKIKTKKVSLEVPDDLIDEFKEMAYQWIYNRTKRD